MKKHNKIRTRNITFIACLFITLTNVSNVFASGDTPDRDTSSTDKDKIEKLLKVMPSASVIMLQMGERYKNLYWAAKQSKWEFAEYQLEEMEQLIETLMITRPNRAKTAMEFKNIVFPSVLNAAKTKDFDTFYAGFDKLRHACISCHAKNDHDFITLPIPRSANSPVLGME